MTQNLNTTNRVHMGILHLTSNYQNTNTFERSGIKGEFHSISFMTLTHPSQSTNMKISSQILILSPYCS